MEVRIQITDAEHEIKYKAERELNRLVEKHVTEVLKNIDFAPLIFKRIEYLIDKSKYVSDSVIRNLVQQKIAREINEKVISSLIK